MSQGFFEILSAPDAPGRMLAAWVVSGREAGSKALFNMEGNQPVPVFRDEGFPDACIREIESRNGSEPGLLSMAGTEVFLEGITRGRKLVVCGGGHVSLPIIRIGRMLDFEITVIEDRKEFADRALQAGARHVICRSYADALAEIEGDAATAFVIVTRAHTHDLECLRLILGKPFGYAGMMGSRHRTGLMREQLLEEGSDPEQVSRVHMPIGLAIGSRTPEEICRLIRAEKAGILSMIVEKNGEAPRKPGTKMLVRRDGSFLGTVGGGYAEAQILKRAREMMERNECRPDLVRISMQKGVMMCGGEIAVFMLPV